MGRALERARRRPLLLARVRSPWRVSWRSQGDHEAAAEALAEILPARVAGESNVLAAALLGRAFVGAVRDEHGLGHGRCRGEYATAPRRRRCTGGQPGAPGRGPRRARTGRPALARRLSDEAEVLARGAGAPFALAGVLNVRVMLAQLAGDDAATVPLLAESLRLSEGLGDVYALAYGLLSWPGRWPSSSGANRPRGDPARLRRCARQTQCPSSTQAARPPTTGRWRR